MGRERPRLTVGCVITDIGGVLVKTDEAILEAIRVACRRKGVRFHRRRQFYRNLGTSIAEYIKNCVPNNCPRKVLQALLDEFNRIYPDQVVGLLRPFPCVDQTLEYLKASGLPVCVMSCMSRPQTERCLSLLKFADFADVIHVEDRQKEIRTAHQIAAIAGRQGVPKGKCLYVGDTYTDVVMGKRAGAISIAVNTGLQPRRIIKEARPFAILPAFSYLPCWLIRRNGSGDAVLRWRTNRLTLS
jgi:phosphoglycolate phosphatase-like HAD superfamily hydrolase